MNLIPRFSLWHGLYVDAPDFGYVNWAYTGRTAFHRLYGQSKLAQIYHARSDITDHTTDTDDDDTIVES